MGEVIHRKAAAADIFADAQSALATATAKGGLFKTLAEEQLQTPLQLATTVKGKLTDLSAKLTPLQAELDHLDDEADALLGHSADEIWNLLGRHREDPYYNLLFPSGIAFYVDGADDDQPARMELLAQLLEAKLVPRLENAPAKQIADKLRASATKLGDAVDKIRGPRTQHEMYSRVYTALARSCQMALVNLKRRYIAAGLTDAEIHSIIPDRSSAAKAPPKGPVTP